MNQLAKILVGLFIFIVCNLAYADSAGPLSSWREGKIKNSIIQFVQTVTDPSSADFVPEADRIATIDNDGTLWVEQPMYTQFIFLIERVKELAKTHPEWLKNPLLKPVFAGDYAQLKEKNLEVVFALTSSGISVEDYQVMVKHWLAVANNPHFHHAYTELVYQPMLEVIRLLQKNHFQVYIVSGGGQDFVRAFAPDTYGIASQHIIGSSTKTDYHYQNDRPVLIKLAKTQLYSNYAGKAEAISLFIGKKPIIAFGNSDGDQQMLEWTQSNPKKHLMLLVHHDDAKREFSYGPKNKVGQLSPKVIAFAKVHGWLLISMKEDWGRIFKFHSET